MNLMKRLLAAVLCAALVPVQTFAQSLAKAPAPAGFSAAVAAPSISAMPALGAFTTPAALTPLLAAPSLTPAALTPILSAAALPAPASKEELDRQAGIVPAKPALEAAAAKVAAAESGSVEAASALEAAYSGSDSAASAETSVPAAPSALSSALTPAAASPSRPATLPPSPRARQAGKANVKLIAGIAAAVVAAVAILIFVLVHNGNAKNKVWEQSRAAQEVAQIDAARRSGDAETLFKLEAGARERQKTAKDKTLDAFDGIVAMRGAVNGNAVSTNPEQRPGGQLPSAWRNRMTDAEDAARQGGSIVPLTRALSDLRAELAKEKTVAGAFEADLRKFKGEVPTIGGALGEQADKATKDLNEFEAELYHEMGMHDQYYASLRRIVTDKLAAERPEFRAALERSDRLTTLAAGSLSTLDDLADKIDADLKNMAAERRAQRDNFAEAARHAADPVLDANGNPVLDADGKPKTQDNSQTWKNRAAQNAANAQASAASAKANIESFNRDLKTLRADRALESEGLDRLLPKSADVGQPDWEHGINRDLLEPWQLGQAATDFTEAEANDARARFGTAKGAVTSVQASVDQRKRDVKQAIDATVDAEIERQSR